MLRAVEIQNYQSHEDTSIEFREGVNVITGASDKGKSSIVRAIRWLAHNRPLGLGMKSFKAAKNALVKVTAEFWDGSWVKRERGDRRNVYLLEDNELEALRADVPDEVKEITGLADYNLQSQHDQYFLLSNPSGEVARMFNEVAGLEVIDSKMKKVNDIIRGAKKVSEEQEEIKIYLVQKLKSYANLPEIRETLVRLEENIIERDQKRVQRESLASLILEGEGLVSEIEEAEIWLEIERKFEPLFSLAEETRNMTLFRGHMAETIDQGQALQESIGKLNAFCAAEAPMVEVIEAIRQWKKDENHRDLLDDLMDEAKGLDEIIEALDKQGSDLDAALNDLLQTIDQCPTCEQSVKSNKQRTSIMRNYK